MPPPPTVAMATVAREWIRIGITGFGGPPAHIALLRRLCVDRREWLTDAEFEDGLAAANLLPGPASTQLAIFCAWRVRGWRGGLVGGACFIVPGLIAILALSALLLSGTASPIVLGVAAGAGAAVPAVAARAAAALVPPSWRRAASRIRWVIYAAAGAVGAVLVGPWLVLVLLAAGVVEATFAGWRPKAGASSAALLLPAAGTWLALVWTAVKVGALSYGGGFVIIPLMRADAVERHHWMTGGQFLDAVALGQITPGPVVQTVAVVGYAAAGLLGGVVAAVVAFAPSFAFVLGGARHFDRLRGDVGVRGFLAGAGPAAIGAIAGSAVPLARSLTHFWQVPVLALAAIWLLAARRGVVSALVAAGIAGLGAALAGLPVS